MANIQRTSDNRRLQPKNKVQISVEAVRLLVLAFIDLDYFIIFDKILLVLFVVGLAYQFLRGYVFWLEPAVVGGSLNISHNLLTAFLSFAIFLLIFLVTKGKGIGMGDIKLFFVLGFLFGFPAILVIVYIALIRSEEHTS